MSAPGMVPHRGGPPQVPTTAHPALGGMPYPHPGPPVPERVNLRQPCGPGQRTPREAEECAPQNLQVEQRRQEALETLWEMSGTTVFWTQPHPLESPPFDSKIYELFERVVVNPPNSPGDSDGDTGATAVAHAEGALAGSDLSQLDPASVTAWVTVVSHTVRDNSLFVIHSVGTWGHDLGAIRDLVRFRVRAGGRTLVDEREMGLLGSVDRPVRVHGLAKTGETVTVECRNLDTASGSLIEAWIKGWEFPAPAATIDNWYSLLPRYHRAPRDRSRFATRTRPGTQPCPPQES